MTPIEAIRIPRKILTKLDAIRCRMDSLIPRAENVHTATKEIELALEDARTVEKLLLSLLPQRSQPSDKT